LPGRRQAKKSAAFGAALNPPKEEGGGDKSWSANLLNDAHYGTNYPRLFCAMQDVFGAPPQFGLMRARAHALPALGTSSTKSIA
jgi:hypothetical protein